MRVWVCTGATSRMIAAEGVRQRALRGSGTAPSVEYDTSPPRGACGDFLRPVRHRSVTRLVGLCDWQLRPAAAR
ncbi:hypothetical protein C3492_06960 [Streptomyces sp. Ru62]|nr:hypothetical protein C3492_06960 [Streptomyces sp. Ru62]